MDLLIFYILHVFLPHVRGALRTSAWKVRLASGTLIYPNVGGGRKVGVEKPHPQGLSLFLLGKIPGF